MERAMVLGEVLNFVELGAQRESNPCPDSWDTPSISDATRLARKIKCVEGPTRFSSMTLPLLQGARDFIPPLNVALQRDKKNRQTGRFAN